MKSHHYRLPLGLLYSMLIAATSLGVLVIAWNTVPAERGGLQLVVHVAALLCLVWSLSHYVLRRNAPHDSAPVAQRELDSVLTIAALVTGLTVVIGMSYVLVTEVLTRTLYFQFTPPSWQVILWSAGVLDIGLVALATYVGFLNTRHPPLMTLVFWILVLGGLWLVMQLIPASHRVEMTGELVVQTVWTHWAGVFALCLGLLIATFVTLEGAGRQQWRASAWPNELWKLIERPAEWPGFRYSVGVLGVIVLVIGCLYVRLPYTFVAAMLASGAMFQLLWRRWEENLADLALGLLALAIVSFCMFGAPSPDYWASSELAMVYNRGMIGLAVATAFFHWLAGFWHQQLDNGVAWTTSGRLIRPAQRVGYICAALTTLFCIHMAFWPRLPGTIGLDNTMARWVWGLGGHGLSIAALAYSAIKTRKATLGWLAVFVCLSLVAFVLIRIPNTWLGVMWSGYWPAVLALMSPLIVAMAGAAVKVDRLKPFHEALFLTGILLVPMSAMLGLIARSRLQMPPNVPVLAFGGLALCYVVAAYVTGPKRFLLPAAVSGVIAVVYCLP